MGETYEHPELEAVKSLNPDAGFTERELKEIEFCLVYAKRFAHGTTGHNAMMVVAKLATIVETLIRKQG